MASSLEELKRRYAGCIWLYSEKTTIEGPVRSHSNPIMPPKQHYRVTITARNGSEYDVETYGEVSLAIIGGIDKQLVIFATNFGEGLAEFALQSDYVEFNKGELEGRRAFDYPR